MQKGFAGIIILVVVLILAGLGGGAYYFGKLPIKPSDNSPKACTQEAKQCPDGSYVSREGPNCEFKSCPTSLPTPSSDETANWKTYIDDKISFKYPAEAITNKDSKGSIYLSYKEPDAPDGVELPQGYLFTVKINTLGNKTLQQIAEADYKSVEDLKKSGCFISKPLTETMINEYSGYTYTGGCQVDGKNIFLSNGNGNYLKITISTNEEKKNYQEAINKILSTFRFIP